MRTSEQLDKIGAALVDFQADLAPVAKDATNPHLKNRYATLDAVWEQIRPLLAKYDLAVIQGPTSEPDRPGGSIGMTTRVIHRSGQWVEETVVIPIGDVGKGRNLAQEVGSTITYLRRYCLAAALGVVVDEDDDAGGDQPRQQPRQPRQPRQQPPPQPPPQGGNGAKSDGPADVGKKAYWNSLGPIERACYRSWDNVRGHLLELDHYEVHQQVSGAIRKLYPGFEKNGYPTEPSAQAGQVRVAVYRTAKAYGVLRDNGMDGARAAVQAFETAKNLEHA